ncbi:MAG: major capsid protein [Microviridae sp.]|nr:MAG: major capsid protein [Microviridae sp.]
MGELIPLTWFEALPGDSIQQATSLLLRVSPLLAPVMHPVHARIHHWFVPNRLIWDKFEDFITGGPDGMDATIPPHIGGGVMTQGALGDYFGVPIGAIATEYSALPFRAYGLIWNEHYRDQDLQPEITVSTASGLDTTTSTTIQNCAWEKDYFTSARPWTQKGPAVGVSLAASAPVSGDGGQPTWKFGAGPPAGLFSDATADPTVQWTLDGATAADPGAGLAGWANPHLVADLTSASVININELRTAFALQRYAEARARFGSRYTEYLAYLGVNSPDARLQRPEYLGGGKQTIQFSEVLQTGPDNSATPSSVVGDLKGHGIGAMRSNRYRRFFPEHGIVMSLLSVKPKTMYSQGLHRSWLRFTKEDYFQRELQHVGQQAIKKAELFAIDPAADDTWGYQDRYDDYRRMESSIAADFRSTLDHWHYARIFAGGTAPVLNGDFIKADPTKRPNAVQTEDVLWIQAYHSIQARRMVARTGTSFIL